jgi:hypothetical protein
LQDAPDRGAIPCDGAGDSSGTANIFAAERVFDNGTCGVRVSVTANTDRTKDLNMMISNEGILSRMARPVAGASRLDLEARQTLPAMRVTIRVVRVSLVQFKMGRG